MKPLLFFISSFSRKEIKKTLNKAEFSNVNVG